MSKKSDIKKTTNEAADDSQDGLTYLYGFGNELQSSCLPGALPHGRNNPRKVPYNLYTEQLSGTAFTKPRETNRRTWLYRIQPSVANQQQQEVAQQTNGATDAPYFGHTPPSECQPTVEALRWHPKPTETTATHKTKEERIAFVEGCQLMCHGGSVEMKQGLAIYIYDCNANMMLVKDKEDDESDTDLTNNASTSMYNADGEFLIVPQEGGLEIVTELGKLRVQPKEICIIPRGVVFSVQLWSPSTNPKQQQQQPPQRAKGYVLEVYGGDGFHLPELGPIGSNGLANARDFAFPTAWCVSDKNKYETEKHTMIIKMQSQLFHKPCSHSPFNVVAWHGNYLPYKYNLQRFCAVNSVSYDHLDPSIYTVLTCPSGLSPGGVALADFVVFPPRMLATDSNTLRPPWFHRNTMSEYMGLIYGAYDAKSGDGFKPGGASLHNCMTPHGPDEESYQRAVADPCDHPVHLNQGMAFMFETYLPLLVAPAALSTASWRDVKYAQTSWQGLSANHFTGWDALLKEIKGEEKESE